MTETKSSNKMTVYLDPRSLDEEPNMTDEEREELRKKESIERGTKLLAKAIDVFLWRPFLLWAVIQFGGLTTLFGIAKITFVQAMGLVLAAHILFDRSSDD